MDKTPPNAADRKAAEGTARERIGALGKAFCDDLNKISAAEMTEWKTEFLTSLTELSEAAKKGSEDVTKQLQEITKTAAEAKAAADKATTEAKAAAKAAEDAARPGAINFAFSPSDFDEEVIVLIDGAEVGRARAKTLAVDRVATGPRKIFASSKKSSKAVATSRMIDIKPGIQDVSLTLSYVKLTSVDRLEMDHCDADKAQGPNRSRRRKEGEDRAQERPARTLRGKAIPGARHAGRPGPSHPPRCLFPGSLRHCVQRGLRLRRGVRRAMGAGP